MQNHHCTVISINRLGILIEGPSGSGKTSLALGLLERAETKSVPCALVADDQALIKNCDGKLIAEVPPTIAGKVEIRGFGISTLPYIDRIEISLIARLVPDEKIERMPETREKTILDVTLPQIDLPCRHEEQAARIVLARLEQIG